MLLHENLELGTEVGFKNPRSSTGLGTKAIAELADDIEKRGLQDPLVVWAYEVDKVTHNVVLRGQRRYIAIGKLIVEGRANGLSKGIPVRFANAADLAEAESLALVDVAHGEGLSTVELAEAIERFKPAKTGKQIAKLLGKSEAWVSRISSAYASAVPELREAWKAGKVPDESAKGLAEVPAAKQAEAVKEFLETRSAGDRKAKAKSREKAVKAAPAKKKGKAEQKLGRRDSKEIQDMLETLGALLEITTGDEEALEAMRAALLWATEKIEAKSLPKAFHDALKEQAASEKAAIKVGDSVKWQYQVNGKKLTNLGKVVEVVAIGKLPKAEVRDPKPRKWLSYVIEAKGGELFYPVPGIVEKA
jgi:ParB-like chromosome segregation protein Spo0J